MFKELFKELIPQTMLALGVLNSFVGNWVGFQIFAALCLSLPLVAARRRSLPLVAVVRCCSLPPSKYVAARCRALPPSALEL